MTWGRSWIPAVILLMLWAGACSEENETREESSSPASGAPVATPKALAEAVGDERTLRVQVIALKRDSTATVALELALLNTSTEPGSIDLSQRFASAAPDRGTLADVYLAEAGANQGRKLFVLRDGQERPDTSSDLTTLEAGQRRVVRARFPAPPEEVRELEVHVPLVPVMKVPIS
ncbi:MAG: hypothetical protein ACRD2X_00635 [Vicinamibacteraceae bacterium]